MVYGGLGALASRSEDAQTVSAPATVVLLGAYFFAMFAALSDPDALTTRIASFLPVTAPLIMPIRLARGQIASWETMLALVLAVASIYVLVRLAGRVYAGALLRTGGKVRLRDAWRVDGAGVLVHPVTVPPAQAAAEGLDADSHDHHPAPERGGAGATATRKR